MGFKNDGGLFEVFRAAGLLGSKAKEALVACNAASSADKQIDIATVYRFLKRHKGEFVKLKGRRFALRSFTQPNVIPLNPRAKKMKDPNHLSKIQEFVHEGFKRHVKAAGLTTEDLDKLIRKESPENAAILGPIEKRRVAHASSRLKQLGLIELCGDDGSGANAMGLYRIAAPKPSPEPTAPAEVIPVTRAADVAQRKGIVLRKGEWSAECPPDMAPEEVAKLMNELAAKTG
jgi:hypothetical protein